MEGREGEREFKSFKSCSGEKNSSGLKKSKL